LPGGAIRVTIRSMSTAPRVQVSEAEYLAWDLEHEGKHEYYDGLMIAMAGAGPRHDRVVANLGGMLYAALRGGTCRHSTADQRVRLDETGLYAYPDATVTCGRAEFADTRPETLLNPTVLFEVLSKTTAAWDAVKAAHYRRRPSVRAYALVSIPDRRVELYEREEDGRWLLSTFTDTAVVSVAAIGITLALADLWDGVDDLPQDEG
jgi:Uma2 family endonuclease